MAWDGMRCDGKGMGWDGTGKGGDSDDSRDNRDNRDGLSRCHGCHGVTAVIRRLVGALDPPGGGHPEVISR